MILAPVGFFAQQADFVLDIVSDVPAVGAYGLRKLRAAYAGPAIRVVRSSDGAEQDIGFAAGSYLDTAPLLAFAGSGSAYIKTWYDQSGNANHVTQTAAANQARIVNAGALVTAGSFVAADFNWAAGTCYYPTTFQSDPPSGKHRVLSVVARPTDVSGAQQEWLGPNEMYCVGLGAHANKMTILDVNYFNLVYGTTTLSTSVTLAVALDWAPSIGSALYVSGVSEASRGVDGVASSALYLGGPHYIAPILAHEFLIFESATFAADHAAKLASSQKGAWGTA